MPMFCVVYGCSNRSNREKTRSFYRVPKVVVHKGEKCKKLTEKRRQTWIFNLNLRSGAAESNNARVCSDHFVNGCPSALKDVDSIDWAPTLKLGHQKCTPMSETSFQREERMKVREDQQRRLDCAKALMDLQQAAESPRSHKICGASHDQQDAGCQTDLTMANIERMVNVLKQTTAELGALRTKALDTQFSRESFEKDDDETKFYTRLPTFFVGFSAI